MITTDVDIANRALRKLGANKLLTDLDNTSDKNAIIMNDLYDDSLRVVLSETNWMFATKRVELSLTSDDTSILWTKNNLIYAYDIPSDFIKLIGWSEPYQNVRQEGDYLVSDSYGGNTEISVNENTTSTPDWLTATDYVVGDFVLDNEYVYYCTTAHTSGDTDDEPGVGATWETYWLVMREIKAGVWVLNIDKKLGLLYLYYNTTIAQYPPYFLEAFVDKLVYDACYMVTQSKSLTVEKKAIYEDTLSDSKAKNSQGQTPTAVRADAWVLAKYSGAIAWDDVGLYYR